MNPAIPIDSSSRDQSKYYWSKISWDKEMSRMADMSNPARALYVMLRGGAWTRQGLPADFLEIGEGDENFKRILRHRCQITFKKFRRLWDEIEEYFTERNGRLYHIDDEDERSKIESLNGKRKEAGKMGAQSRWNRASEQAASTDLGAMATAIDPEMASAIPVAMANASQTTTTTENTEEIEKKGEPLLPQQVEVEEDAHSLNNGTCHTTPDGSKGLSNNISPTLGDQEYQEFCAHCADLSTQAQSTDDAKRKWSIPGRDLALRIKRKFPNIPLSKLPRFANQQSPAMWASDNISVQQVQMEIARQSQIDQNPGIIKKPVESMSKADRATEEAYQRMKARRGIA